MSKKKKQFPDIIKRRLELSKIFITGTQAQKRKWGRVFKAGFDGAAGSLNQLAEEMEYSQQKVNRNSVIWYNPNDNSPECMFCYIDNPTNINQVTGVFRLIKKHHPMFTYGIVKQFKDGDGVFDIFRFSKFSYLEHHNRMKAPV